MVASRFSILFLFATLQLCAVPAVAWFFPWLHYQAPRLFMTANPPVYVEGFLRDIELKCEIRAGTKNLAAVQGLVIQKYDRVTRTFLNVSAALENDMNDVYVDNVRLNMANITADQTGSVLSIILPSAQATNNVGVYRCLYIATAHIHYKAPVVNILQRSLTLRELTAYVLNNTNTNSNSNSGTGECNCTTDVTELQEQVSMLQANISEVTSLVDREFRTSQWPRGQYALLKPETGCPDDPAFRNQQMSFVSFETESTMNAADNSAYFNTHLSTPVITSINSGVADNVYLRFCPVSNKLSSFDWPAGTYCINKAATNCPTGFTAGNIMVTEESSDGGMYQSSGGPGTRLNNIDFCCRSDGPVSTPITLPTDTPFYLYRAAGMCQRVTGMASAQETLCIDTEDTSNMDITAGAVPIASLASSTIILNFCHYVST